MASSIVGVRITALIIFFIGAIAAFFAAGSAIPGWSDSRWLAPFARPFVLGLDLQGGTHLLYRADTSVVPPGTEGEAMESLRDAIERRINLFGVSEPLVQVERSGEEWRLVAELAGEFNIEQAIRRIGETPTLEFREPRSEEEAAAILEAQANGERLEEHPYFGPPALGGSDLSRADLQFDATTNAPVIAVTFSSEGARKFEELTGRNIDKPIAILLDGQVLSAPIVQEEIGGGQAQITGQFTIPEAREMVRHLNAGALPVPIELVNQKTVEASLGAASLERSLFAALIGFIAVAVFMVFWYRLPGAVSVVALSLYAALVLTIFKLLPVTLTAAGIAGFVLSIGMAVDANVLIFERMREELRRGKDLSAALREGFARAWTSIRDSNVSSLITAVILYWLGTSVVRGFALTLGIGVLVSMFSAIMASRIFMAVLVSTPLARARPLFGSGIRLRGTS